MIDRKTASLFYAGGRLAAELAGVSTRTIDSMAKLGTAMGLAFQMVDDLLDILGPEEKIGKPVGSDLRAGIPSLPVVLGVERSAELRTLFQNGTQMEGAAFERALDLLRDPEIIAAARRLAAEQVAIARTDRRRARTVALPRRPGDADRRSNLPRSLSLHPSPSEGT